MLTFLLTSLCNTSAHTIHTFMLTTLKKNLANYYIYLNTIANDQKLILNLNFYLSR